MAQEFGVSFAPMGQKPGQAGDQAAGPSSPVADAIKVLSLRIPRVTGPGGIAAAPLLSSPGAQSVMGSLGGGGIDGGMPGGLEALLRRLFGGMGAGAPAPNVTPGVTGPGGPGGPLAPPPAQGVPLAPQVPPTRPTLPNSAGGGEEFKQPTSSYQ